MYAPIARGVFELGGNQRGSDLAGRQAIEKTTARSICRGYVEAQHEYALSSARLTT
jgi:hypothetical protein